MGCCWPTPAEEENINLEIVNLDGPHEIAEFDNVVVQPANEDLPLESLEVSLVHEAIEPSLASSEFIPVSLAATEEDKMKIGHLVTTLLKTNEQAVVVLLNQVIHTMLRKIFKANGLKEPLRILKEFVDLLSAEHKKELEDMLKHLPACVLGNEEEREQLRVFTNIFDDLKKSSLHSPGRLNLSQEALLQELTALLQREGNVFACLKSLDSALQFRIIMTQILLSKILKENADSRLHVLMYLFSEGS